MDTHALTAISPLDGRYEKKLAPLKKITSEYGLIYYRSRVEIRWLIALCQSPKIKEAASLTTPQQQALEKLISIFDVQQAAKIKKIEATTNHDVKAVEYYLQQQISDLGLASLTPFIHFACTSEDINNLAYGLMLKDARLALLKPMQTIIKTLNQMAEQQAELPMLARTHGQTASPTTLGKEIKNVVVRLERQLQTFQQLPISGKLNGAVGNFNAHCIAYPEVDWLALSEQFVTDLGLQWNAHTTQIEPHDNLAELLQALSRFNTILIDFNRDIWSYISIGYFGQKKIETEVGSSTMPHKINPIDFENAEGNLGLANALAQHLANKLPISRWQRDLTDSTVLRNLGSVFAYALIAYQSTIKGLGKLIPNQNAIVQDLDQHWEVLAEAVQTVMRRYGINEAYEKLKAFTRGQAIDQNTLSNFVDQLQLPDAEKERLKKLTPQDYIGYAVKLAKDKG